MSETVYSANKFEFAAAAPDGVSVTIDESTSSKQQLLERLAQGLSFPDYFGENWDALIDCLSDLTWSEAPEIVIDHAVVPDLPQRELRLYLECLVDALDRRSPERRPQLRVVFRARDRERVAAALSK